MNNSITERLINALKRRLPSGDRTWTEQDRADGKLVLEARRSRRAVSKDPQYPPNFKWEKEIHLLEGLCMDDFTNACKAALCAEGWRQEARRRASGGEAQYFRIVERTMEDAECADREEEWREWGNRHA